MKKFFLIPLMALMCSVASWGITRTAGTFDELQSALTAAGEGDVIELTADIPATSTININKSIAIDGKKHKITGAIKDTGILKIQGTSDNQLLVALANVEILNTTSTAQSIVLMLAGYIDSLAINNCELKCVNNVGNPKPIEFNGVQPQPAKIGIHNSHLFANNSGYSIRSWNPVILNMTNSVLEGYGNLNFQPNVATSTNPTPYMGFSGTRGSKIYATNCNFIAPNIHSGGSNGFACFAFRDDGIDLTLTNCGMNAEETGNAKQYAFDLGGWWFPAERLCESLPEGAHDINITIEGDNSHINGRVMLVDYCIGTIFEDGVFAGFRSELGARFNKNTYAFESFDEEKAWKYQGNINVVIKGGTFAINPAEETYNGHIIADGLTEEQKRSDPDELDEYKEQLHYTIPSTHEVQEVKQGDVTLYRVVKKAAEKEPGVKYDLNDLVAGEGEAEGNNPVSSFDLSSGEEMELNQETTTAGYVQVSDKDNGEAPATPTVVQVGKVENPGTDEETKVDQTLVINNGLDVSGDSRVEVQAGSALVIGEGGINTEKPENIVIEADKEGAASLLLDPTITVNQTPELTVKMTAQQVGYKPKTSDPSKYDYYWHRFAMPVDQIDALPREPYVGTSIKFWDFTIGTQGDWADIPSLGAMKPFIGYNLCPASAPQDVVYTFKGKLVGNTNNPLEFSKRGFNFFGNSYTGYISLKQLTDMILGDASLEGTVWVWNTTTQTYSGVSLTTLKNKPSMYEDWQKEVAPMHTFILKLESDELPEMEINYASAIWGNPRYSAVTGVASAPARYNEVDDPAVRIEIAANGKKDFVLFYESAELSDAFDNGYDASKFMNEGTINAYSTITGVNFSTVATNNLEGKTISLNTNDEVSYTLSFSYVSGEDYALEDVVTGKVIAIKEGTTYEFAAQPNSVVADRFRIVGAHKVPTSVETTEVKNSVKGIYTVLGQYVGEDFHTLPSGVYVVDGVKIVK